MSKPQSATKRTKHLPRPTGMLPCLLPPVSDDDDDYNDENDPSMSFSPRSDLDEDDLPTPVAPPLEERSLIMAQPFNHSSFVSARTPLRGQRGVASSKSPKRKNTSIKLPPRPNLSPPKTARLTSRSRRPNHDIPSSNRSVGSSSSGTSDADFRGSNARGATSKSQTRNGYDSDNLSRTAFARRKEKTLAYTLRRKTPSFANVSALAI